VTGASLRAVCLKAPLGNRADQLQGTLRIWKGAILCNASWPKEHSFADMFQQIAGLFSHHEDPIEGDASQTHMSLHVPPEVTDLEAGEAWFRTLFGISGVQILPTLWTISTSGDELEMRLAIDEPILCIQRKGDQPWKPEAMENFLARLNESPWCERGTAERIDSSNVEVYLSAAALREPRQLTYMLPLAELYK